MGARKRSKKNKWSKMFFIIILVLLMIGIAGITVYAYKILNIETFYDGVEVDGILLNTMNKEEALDKFKADNQPDLDKINIILTYEDQKWEYDYNDINAQIDIEEIIDEAYAVGREGNSIERLKEIYAVSKEPKRFETKLTYDVSLIDHDIEGISKEINVDPIDATIEFQPSNRDKFTFTPEKSGKRMLTEKAKEEIKTKVDADDFSVYEISMEELNPNYTLDEVKTWTSRIANYSTKLDNRADRNHNIELSSSAFYNVRLNPGEEYSLNDATGPRGAAEGYRAASVIKQGKKFEDEPGGGNCQTSTTLYGAVMRADLDIVNRYHHSIRSTYTDIGTDAMVDYPWADLKFKNNQDTPIFITRYMSGGRIYVEVYGKPSSEYDEIRIVGQLISESSTPEYKIVEDPNLLEGTEIIDWKSRAEIKAVSYKIFYKNGKEIKRVKEANSTYPKVVGQKTVGTKKKPVEEPIELPIEDEPIDPIEEPEESEPEE